MNQPDLFNIPAAEMQSTQSAAAECSAEALAKVDAKALRQLCLEEYERRPQGATADEIFQAVRWRVPGPLDELSIRPRVTGLKNEGLLVLTGEHKINRKGNWCAVLIHRNFVKGAV